jgi:hypothetical protein
MAIKDVSCYPDTVRLLWQHGAYIDTGDGTARLLRIYPPNEVALA